MGYKEISWRNLDKAEDSPYHPGNSAQSNGGHAMAKTAAEMVAEAKSRVENLTVDQVAEELAGGNAVLVDIREPGERTQNGIIPGAIAAPRGMLEFYADPASPYHKAEIN